MPSPTRSSFLISPQPTKSHTKMGRTLLVLLWKHFTVRCRRFIHTPIEYILPIVYFVLLYLAKDFFHGIQDDPEIQQNSNDIVTFSQPIEITKLMRPDIVLYYPSNNLTDELMNNVGRSLKLKPMQHFTVTKKGIYGTNDMVAINEYMKEFRRDTHAFVSFENMNGSELPDHLNYTIRLKTNFETQMYEAMDQTVGPHKMFGLQYEVFVRLQWAIDSSFLERRSGEPVNKVVSIQELPALRARSSTASTVALLFIVIAMIVALLLPFFFLMCRLMEERASGVQELIKMVGVSTRTLGLSHLINVLPGGIIFSVVGAVLLTISSTPLIPYSNGFLIWLLLFLFFLSIVSLAMLSSYVTNSTEHTSTVALLMYMLSLVPASVLGSRFDIPNPLMPVVGMLPFMPIFIFLTEMFGLESNGLGITFKTMMSSHSNSNKLSCMFLVYVLLLLQTVVWLALAWYCSLVRPGQYGTALPWNFICRKEYWTKNEVHPDLETEQEREKISTESKYFEQLPPNSEVGIEIDNVTKVFSGGGRALSNVSLHVLKGEITVLLGHNGAGKTTLMSIVTGMMSATQGKVFVNGLDIVSQQTEVRSNLGFCPQHNLFFPDLTVLQHVIFFSLLKGVSPWQKASAASMDLLDQLGLASKASNMCHELSGGMKRRLQLAFALAGDATVLVLDEPTAGLDIETRRGLWDLLLSLRAGRTVLLSTHFMEEADALGDRVAALHSGSLRCYATPMHLKKEIDTGYRLSITMKPEAASANAEAAVDTIVLAALPRATPLHESGVRTIAYKLPSRESDKFPELFKKLEGERDKLGVESIGVGVSTLEEVFLKLCSDVNTLALGDEVDSMLQDEAGARRVRGPALWCRQFAALLLRQLRYVTKSWKMYIFLQIILPILVLVIAVRLCNELPETQKERNPPADMNFDIYRELDGRRALARLNVPLRDAACCGLTYAETDDIAATLANIAREDKYVFSKYLIGVELNDTHGVAHYSTCVRHALPVSVNALSNALGASLSARAAVTTRNHPLDGSALQEQIKLKEPKSLINVSLYATVLGFFIMAILISVGILPSNERLSSTRHIHVMSGCSPELHLTTTLLFHVLYAVVILVVPSVIFAYTLEQDSTISQPDFLKALAVVLFLGCVTFIAFAMLVSFVMSDRRGSTALIAIIIVFGYVVPSYKAGCEYISRDSFCSVVEPFATLTSYSVPPHAFSEALMKIALAARVNAWCPLNNDRCPNLEVNESDFDAHKCCVLNEPQRCYLCNDKNSALTFVCILVGQFIVIMILIFLSERGVMRLLYDRLMNFKYFADTPPKDDLLEKEQQYVETALNHPKGDAMLVSSVHKRYPSLMCGSSMTAVKGVSFSVREGECFGLVGVNGAGKSSTFKMMTYETCTTRGTIVANEQHQNMFNNSKYLNGLGYCPQFFSLDGFLTGRQNMELLLTLGGLTTEDAKKEAVAWLELIDLMKHADKKVSSYSGGCSRRLCSVAALARRAALSLLDEPTAGVDVAARRQLWRAVRAAQAQTTLAGRKRAVLITSHSMDEMEALCARVSIMSAGRLMTLGSPAALRAAHKAGLALSIKIKDNTRTHGDVTDSAAAKPELQKLKEECLKFQWTPKDEHKTMLSYHVDKKLKMEYSELFTKLEKLRKDFPGLVEDYAVTETTLEQVFLQYAKPEKNVQGPFDV